MKRIVSIVASLFFAIIYTCCFADIPQGDWMKKTQYNEDMFLEIRFDSPKIIDGKSLYGSMTEISGSKAGIIMFGKPEITGNSAKCKSYQYVQYFDVDDPDKNIFFNDIVYDCIMQYDPQKNILKIKVGDDLVENFTASDRRTRAVCNADKLNIRKSPVNGEKIGSMTKGQTLPVLSVVPAKKTGKQYDNWYEVQLPDSRTGFVSGRYINWVSPSSIAIRKEFLTPKISYSHLFDNRNPNFSFGQTLTFVRKGNQVLCYFQQIPHPESSRMGIEEYYMGHIDENKIVLDSCASLWTVGPDVDLEDIFEKADFNKFAKCAEKMEKPDVYYFDNDYWNGCILDSNGTEFHASVNEAY